MAVTIATSANYWIAPNALSISLNALGEPNRIQCSVASGAAILVFIRGVKPAGTQPSETDPDADYSMNGEGLEYDNGHNYRRWPLVIWPSFFYTNTERYVYVAVPRSAAIGNEAMVVFPSQKLDIYGYTVEEEIVRNSRGQMIDADGNIVTDPDLAAREEVQGEQIGTDDYFYIWLQGIISDSGTQGTTARHWTANCESGYLDSDEAVSSLETEWYRWDPISQTVTFLKEIFMDEGSIFANLKASLANIMNLNVTGLLSAAMAKINDIKSDNYNAGLTDGTGFRLTNDDGEGNSLLEVDNLKVRKKATFMELEIRKETYVGGNQTYSPAGSVIYRVEYMTENNEMLGYETMKVPFLLKRMAFLGGPFRLAFNYAARRRVRRGMEDDDWKRCHHFRCYLISDDGTTATRNWWRVGDQAKCQSFNRTTSEEKRKVNGNTGKWSTTQQQLPPEQEEVGPDPAKVENSYFWRLITKVGADMLDDGYVYDFVDMPCETWLTAGGVTYTPQEIASFRDSGSDYPSAGDTIVCVGNRYDQERMNLVSINTTGADNNPPSIKGYSGVHNFRPDINNQKFQISPEYTFFRAKRFELLNEDNDGFPVPLDRGEWIPGMRYRYYDRVSWNGSVWLCIVLDDYVWENKYGVLYDASNHQWVLHDGTRRAAGEMTNLDLGEGSFEYIAYDYDVPLLDDDEVMDGDEVYRGHDHYYATGEVDGQTVYKVMRYTYREPSDENNAVWLCEVSKGTEITESVIHYAASLDGINHPADDSEAWKTNIADTGIKPGQYLWTRRTTYYRDPNNPDREPTVEYSVARWGIDGDGIASINSYYTAVSPELNETIEAYTDASGNKGMSAYDKDHPGTILWYETFDDAVYMATAAHPTVGELQGWYIWEKTQITYDLAPNPDGTPRTQPDLINYRCSRIGSDGQIAMEEYYVLLPYDTFEAAFPNSTGKAYPGSEKIGIRWLSQADPASENYRLINSDNWYDKVCIAETKAQWISKGWADQNTPVWSAVMPTYDKSTAAKAKNCYLWNFEYRVDGMGTAFATRPVCIGDHSRGIIGVLELYACSASGQPASTTVPIPQELVTENGGVGTYIENPTPAQQQDLRVWSDEKYDRAPTEAKPYQWNFTRTLYSQPKNGSDTNKDPKTGWWYEDHYHVSAVKGTKGQDGSGVEYVYFRTANATAPSTPPSSGKGAISPKGVANGTTDYDKTLDDWVPNGWSDSPMGIEHDKPYEWVSERQSKATTGEGGFTGSHEWGAFSEPKIFSKWGFNGQDGDGTEYVFIRTTTNVAPTVNSNSADTSGRTYLDDEYLPKATGGSLTAATQCTDDPRGVNSDYPYEWVAKRTMGTPSTAAATQGQRQWNKYTGTMALWSHFAESITRVSETYRYATNNTGTRPAASSSEWKTTKPTLAQGYWLYTEITITWSDGSTTVLYTDERNPNDGISGMDIIVDGATEMKYAVTDSNASHPAESSSDWKDYSAITLTKGKWLWSKATTHYRKSGSAAGAHDAGSSVNYNVSYIPNDGAAGRALTSVTEYYKATDSPSSYSAPPTSDSGWSTDPNNVGWGESKKYLWNYEKATYSSGTTVERTTPTVIAIWTKDGKGIDSITNYYKVTSSATAPSRPSEDGTDGWDDNPTAPGEGEYLWNYEKIVYTDGDVSYTDVQLIGHVGKDAVVFTIECADTIKPGDTSLAVSIKRSKGTDIQVKGWSAASSAWNMTITPSISGGGSASMSSTGVTLSGTITAATVLTLTLKVGSNIVATKTVRAVADGSQGNAGHVGRWFYYAGEWSSSETYKFEPTRAPFVSRKGNFYMLDFMAHPSYVQSNTVYTSTNEDPDDGDYRGGDPWSAMTAVFKYLITEATFSDFAHLGAFVFNGDWMISCNGTINGTAYNSPSWQNPATYNGAAAYTWFDPAHPNESVAGGHTVNGKSWQGYNFAPNFAIDGLTGKVYMNDAYVKGQIVATSGTFTGTVNATGGTINGDLIVGSSNNNKIVITSNGDNSSSYIVGKSGTKQVFKLGFDSSGNGSFSMNYAYMRENCLFLEDADGNRISIVSTPTSVGGENSATDVLFARTVNGAEKYVQVGINASGKCIIKTNCLPIEPSLLEKGTMYAGSDGIVRIRTY